MVKKKKSFNIEFLNLAQYREDLRFKREAEAYKISKKKKLKNG
jgi:hypothetical protein